MKRNGIDDENLMCQKYGLSCVLKSFQLFKMKKSLFLLIALFLTMISCKQTDNNQASLEGFVEEPTNEQEQNEQVLRHVVLFKFKDSATKADIQQIVESFRKLPEQIDGIRNFEWGTDVSPEGLSNGFTHVFFVTFEDEQSRDAYLPHPAHEAFGGIVGPHLEKVLVVDYWPQG